MNELTRRIRIAAGEEKAPLVLKGARIVNVFTKEVETGDIAIADGRIAGIGQFSGVEEIDASGKTAVPGFIDGHVHIESSMVSPSRFSDVVVPHGVTSIVTDPHEIANVSGTEGIRYMLDDSEDVPLHAYFMLPSCVPATPFENSGSILTSQDLLPFYDHPRVIGLAEVMDYPSVAGASPDMTKKLADAEEAGKNIDGHAAGFTKEQLMIYRAAGITTDHECTTAEQALERVQSGMYVIIREGSAAKDLRSVLPAVSEKNARRFLFCTDDKHLDELMEQGSIDDSIRIAVEEGLDAVTAIQMATLNAAECFGLKQKGAVAPGYDADIVLLDDLESLQVTDVFTSGEHTASNGKMIHGPSSQKPLPASLSRTVNLEELSRDTFHVDSEGTKEALTIDYIPNSIVTEKSVLQLPEKNRLLLPSKELDVMKLAVLERHHQTGNVGRGFIRGLTFETGAFALTVAHDSHNIVTAGFEDEDMKIAAERVKEMQGGLVLVKHGKVLADLPLDISGLMSSAPAGEAVEGLLSVERGFQNLGFKGGFNPISALSFMCLPVIPLLKLTDMGYFDSSRGEHVSVKP
ncbi:adenine deaminase [Alkalicoccus urumqiensis]|uniref:Adenine deaminase n=1 Tax=Alkalicoccus urumqiensis TaxID=1548213 RepID=A0A2P6MIM0_ALKUR|nr:adenine deaminase [Alkalicoccus urumqiensis]PRO66142.1 adenine deaminase [Alkalicoccus urumqiensis]